MAFADYTAYKTAVSSPFQVTRALKPTFAVSTGGHLWALFSAGGLPPGGGVPTAAALDSTSTGALQFKNGGGSVQRLARMNAGGDRQSAIFLCDRLIQTGGLDGTVTSAQTTNLPTPSLPSRATGGAGVWAALEIYTAIGTTSSTATMSYTNSAGTAGQASQVVKIGQAPDNVGKKFIIVPLAAGDTGVRSVESVTLSGTTGTAGNFGVTLFKPFWGCLPLGTDPAYVDAVTAFGCVMPSAPDDACLMYLCSAPGGSVPQYHDEIIWVNE